MPNPDQDARSDMLREPDPSPVLPTERTSPHQDPAAHDLSQPGPAANDAGPLPARARPARRRKPADLPAADAAPLFDPPDASTDPDARESAVAPPRAAPRRRSPRAAPSAAAAPDSLADRPESVDVAPAPETPLPRDGDAAVADATIDPPAADAPAEVVPPASVESSVDPAGSDMPNTAGLPPPPAEPAPKAAPPAPAKPLTITASDAALAVINPHPIRANDRPDGYLYHLTSPNEAKVLLQSGLPCSFDDPIILTERGGIPYWMSVLSEDLDDILDGPAAVTVLRIRRRAVQNAVEPDADSTRAAQAPCYLLTGVSGLPPVPAPPPPPLLRARPPAPVAAGDAGEPGAGVEMGGTVKWYNPRKGFGFITPGSGGKDVFVHASTLERAGLAQLTDGQNVRMQVIQGAKGPEAASLSLA